MPAGDLRSLLAASFWERNHGWVSAAIALLLALLAATLVDRAFAHRGRLTREMDTRLRFVRRAVTASILLIGIALALSQFTGLNRLAASVLASGAIVAAIIGFAAQRTLGNVVAGVLLAVSQPIRIGDWIAIEDHYGQVEDVRLNFTVLRVGHARVIVPNERLVSSVLRNDTLSDDAVDVSVDLWLPLGADADAAVDALEQETGGDVAVAAVSAGGVRLSVTCGTTSPPGKGAHESALRARCLRRLRAAGVLDEP